MTYEFRQDVIVPGTVKVGGVENSGSQWSGTTHISNPDDSLTASFWTYDPLTSDYHLKVQETAKYNPADPQNSEAKDTIINLPDPIIVHGRELIIEDTGGYASYKPITIQFTDKFTGALETVYVINKNYEKIKITADGSKASSEVGNGWRIDFLTQHSGFKRSQEVVYDLSIAATWTQPHDGVSEYIEVTYIQSTGAPVGSPVLALEFRHPAENRGKIFSVFNPVTQAPTYPLDIRWRTRDGSATHQIESLKDNNHISAFMSTGNRYLKLLYTNTESTATIEDDVTND